MTPEQNIIEAAHALAQSLPNTTATVVAMAIMQCPEHLLVTEIAQRVPHLHHRDLAVAFLKRWRSDAQAVDARTVAVALQTAARCEQAHRDFQSVELVWTGPDTGEMPFRRTEQAIQQVIDTAKKRIILVSFAVYKIPNVANSLVRAAQRGVQLTVIVETPNKIDGQGEYNTIMALSKEVAACSAVYFWPQVNRPHNANGKPGILHVKCAVADGEWLFLSSANLTQQAFTINMELGMLVHGGLMPSRVQNQFDQLIERELLQVVSE